MDFQLGRRRVPERGIIREWSTGCLISLADIKVEKMTISSSSAKLSLMRWPCPKQNKTTAQTGAWGCALLRSGSKQERR